MYDLIIFITGFRIQIILWARAIIVLISFVKNKNKKYFFIKFIYTEVITLSWMENFN